MGHGSFRAWLGRTGNGLLPGVVVFYSTYLPAVLGIVIALGLQYERSSMSGKAAGPFVGVCWIGHWFFLQDDWKRGIRILDY